MLDKKILAEFAEWIERQGYVKLPFENKWQLVNDVISSDKDYVEQLENKFKTTLELVDKYLESRSEK